MTLANRIEVRWVDRGRWPQNPPNPEFPNGIDLDLSNGARASCLADLPYPAKRCGIYVLKCETCEQTAAITTAGRSDDPKSARLACLRHRVQEMCQHQANPKDVGDPNCILCGKEIR